jgi:hypothetical protein
VTTKWTKRDLKSLRGAIDHWWLFNRMYLRQGVTIADVFAAMPAGERARIVVSHFRGFANMLEERATGHCGYKQTHEHYESKRELDGWGDVTEIVERFKKLEIETLADVAKIRALISRVEAEGLPEEIANYVPRE